MNDKRTENTENIDNFRRMNHMHRGFLQLQFLQTVVNINLSYYKSIYGLPSV